MANSELGVRLKKARESMGYTLVEASRKLGFQNYQTLINIESGVREVKASELTNISKVYFISIINLLDEKAEASPHAFLWRRTPQDKKKKAIEASIVLRCEQYYLLERLLNLKLKIDVLPGVETIDELGSDYRITLLAKKLHENLGLGNRPALAVKKVLEHNYGIKVLLESMPEGSAVSTVSPRFGPVVIVNSEEKPWRQNYDLAHELFHLVSWNVASTRALEDPMFFDEIEKKAEKFASVLLLPEDEIRKEVTERIESQKHFTHSDLVDIAIEFGVSVKALLYRMANLHLLTWEEADKTANDPELVEVSKHKRKGEGGDMAKPGRFVALAVRCLRKGLVSRGKFAEIIGIDRSGIDDFIERIGLMELEGDSIEIMAT